MSADQLAANGIGPNDPRVQKMFGQCARAAEIQTAPIAAAAPTGSYNPDFVIEGLAVGGLVHPGTAIYRSYKCHSSEEFAGFTWCAIKHPLNGRFGPYDSWVTILHSDANTAVFVMQDVIPAFFSSGDVEREIQRLSEHFGQAARIYTEPRQDAAHSVIATWGDVTLTPVDQPTMEAIERGDPVNAGLVIDFLADSRKSARQGLPVFHMAGGNGYIWAAMVDDSGRGRLRIAAVNPSLLPERSSTPAPQDVPAYAPSPASPPPGPTAGPDPAAVEKERAARSQKAVSAANSLLEDAGAFVKEHPQSPKLLDYIERIAALSAAVKTNDPDEVERAATDLDNSLNHDKDYQQYQAEQVDKRKKLAAQNLGDAIRRGQQERDFILDYISKNPLADVTPSFAGFVKELNPALQKADLDQLQPLVAKVGLAIREANLEASFMATLKDASKTGAALAGAANQQSEKSESTESLPVTPEDRFLVEGDLDDVEIVYNASSAAPHVAQNLRGDFVFAEGQARVCLFGQNPDELAFIVEQAITMKAQPKHVGVSVEPCNPERLLTYDIAAMQRNAFLRSKQEDALALIKYIEEGGYRKFAEVTAADLNKAADAERAQIEKIKANVNDGAPDGYGIILLKSGSSNLCIAVGSKVSAHRQLLLGDEEKLDLEMQTGVLIKDTTIDDAFINVQKGQCGAVYASAADLNALIAALTRNSIRYSFSSVWNLPDDVNREDTSLAEKAATALREENERQQRNADRRRLDEMHKKDLDGAREAKQAELRQKFGESAKAEAGALSSEIIAWTKDQKGQIGAFYPDFANWLADKLNDHWEIVTVDSDVQDFGTADFKTRSLDTVFSKITLHLKNRMLGEYEDSCFIFGRINDTEFSMWREPAYTKCDDEAAIEVWQVGHDFKTQWFVSSLTVP